MTNPWAGLELPANGSYFNLSEAGQSFEGTVKSVTKSDPFGEGEVPRVLFEDEGEGEKHFDFVAYDARRKVTELKPGIGSRIRVTRGSKVKGSRMVEYTVELVDNASDRPSAATPEATGVAKDTAPPF